MQSFDTRNPEARRREADSSALNAGVIFPPPAPGASGSFERGNAGMQPGYQPDWLHGVHEGQEQIVPLRTLLRQTGLGIKLRFLLALIFVAVLPASVLVLVLGDPSGQEQRTALSNALFMQVESQAGALNQIVTERQQIVSSLAQGALPNQNLLQAIQGSDATMLVLAVVRPDGQILVAGDNPARLAGLQLAQTKVVSNPGSLTTFVHAIANGTSDGTPLLSNDARIHGGWLAFGHHLAQGNVLLAIFSLQRLVQQNVSVSQVITGETEALLDQQGRLIASAGQLAQGQQVFTPVPAILQTLPLSGSSSSNINDPLTGRTDIVRGASIPTLRGRLLLFAPQDASLAPDTRQFFAGRNTPLLILGILVAVVLVATWVALPIIRPIRRATREIVRTTDNVRELAMNAEQIAQDHVTGTTILSAASRRLRTRRDAIIRDSQNIARFCQAVQPRLQLLFHAAQDNQHLLEALRAIQQTIYQNYQLGSEIAAGLQGDEALDELSNAMKSAEEISAQFIASGRQLDKGADQLETAAKGLL